MKKLILAAALLAFAGGQVQTAKAGGWGIAAGVLGGVAAGTVIAESIAHPPVYYAPAPTYYYPPATAYPAAPPVVYSAPVYPYYYAPAPVVTFGFGYRPYYRGYYGRPYYPGYHGYYGRR